MQQTLFPTLSPDENPDPTKIAAKTEESTLSTRTIVISKKISDLAIVVAINPDNSYSLPSVELYLN